MSHTMMRAFFRTGVVSRAVGAGDGVTTARVMHASRSLRSVTPSACFSSSRLSENKKSAETTPITPAMNKIYELRTYNIVPAAFPDFLALTKEKFHMRTAVSKLNGYWTTEIGGQNQVVHIWEYDNVMHRVKVRAELAGNKKWGTEYMAPMRPMLQSQENHVLVAPSWWPYREPSEEEMKTPGVYELRQYRLAPGKVGEWLSSFKSALALRSVHSAPVGGWVSDMGDLNVVTHLWRYKDLEERETVRAAVAQDEEYRAAVTRLMPLIQKQTSKILLPCPWSTLQ
eukprot:TRINITY_DN9380_c0_g1_i1.p1 TRINITY_DN9380_c0_g1~~TRINITY_DN9380_c0_g1_i1.p1  ORF type:complete len:294 (-),score=44.61 TRINITY_DN9380_c0_g1_i1:160-1011(-)